jgi:hypothetical protein
MMGKKRTMSEQDVINLGRQAIDGGEHPDIMPLLDSYAVDAVERQKGRDLLNIALKRESELMGMLKIDAPYPTNYGDKLTTITTFYQKLSENPDDLQKVARVKITGEVVAQGLHKIDKVMSSRTRYTDEKGEAQVATQNKEIALENLDTWMDDYLDMSRIALKRNPQLLEIMGIVVPS